MFVQGLGAQWGNAFVRFVAFAFDVLGLPSPLCGKGGREGLGDISKAGVYVAGRQNVVSMGLQGDSRGVVLVRFQGGEGAER